MVHFEVLEKVDDKAYRLNLTPYIFIYLVVNVESLKLYEPSILVQELKLQVLSSLEDLTP